MTHLTGAADGGGGLVRAGDGVDRVRSGGGVGALVE